MTTIDSTTAAELARLRAAFDGPLGVGLTMPDPLTLDDAETLVDGAAARHRAAGRFDVGRQLSYAASQIAAAKGAASESVETAYAYAAAQYAEQAVGYLPE